MKKLLIPTCLLLVLPFIISFKQDFKKPVQLSWETHYKGVPDKNSPYLALTSLIWKYSYSSSANKTRVKIKLDNTVTVDASRSWVKWDKIKNPEIRASLLHHEQGHVNIEYILLKEADRVLKNRNYSVTNYKAEIADLANQISVYFDTMQKNYDEETAHGSNHKMQARWDKIIADKAQEISEM